jgi:hypothetical protein
LKFKGRKSGTKLAVVEAALLDERLQSPGRVRYAVLLGIGKKGDQSCCLIDLKEAASAVAPQGKITTKNNAQGL